MPTTTTTTLEAVHARIAAGEPVTAADLAAAKAADELATLQRIAESERELEQQRIDRKAQWDDFLTDLATEARSQGEKVLAAHKAAQKAWATLEAAADEYAAFSTEAARGIAHDFAYPRPDQVLDRLGVDPGWLLACPDPDWSAHRFVEMTRLLMADPAIVSNRVLDRLKPAS